jgi:NADPH2 dehydrogenase
MFCPASLDDSIVLSKELKKLDVDLIDVSTAGNYTNKIYPGYQIEYAAKMKQSIGIKTFAVGMIDTYEKR